MKFIRNSKHDGHDRLAETIHGHPGAAMIEAALGLWVVASDAKGRQKIAVCGSGFTTSDVLGGDTERQLWYGNVILLPAVKFRAEVTPGLRADQFLCRDFAHPDGWKEQIFGARIKQ